ncbi:MAG: glycine cleavage system protein GcvH [Verrucomicrobia bacterium]|nr:glycine cleavage system protein GcvH [Verrucomicrobiota bacterium]
MKKYTESHEWILVDHVSGTVGITHFAQQELGELVYVELPKTGQQIKAGEEVVVLESTKAAVDVCSPVSGEITAVNERLKLASQIINQSPENAGWLFKIKLSDPGELEQLLDQESYDALTSS